ncbi:MAG TPA: ISNCY family transposase [Thermomicrobiales bacterium]|nr:ISNCY family transposase [Thermomicrobiales bacterium]
MAPCQRRCPHCGGAAPVAYHSRRTVATLDGLARLTLVVRRCHDPACPRYRRPYRPEAEGRRALPHGEFGLDVIALVGRLRCAEHRSVPEIRQALAARGVAIAERSVTEQLRRYEELVALRLADRGRLRERLAAQERVILALDGLQPDVGHEVLWVLRDGLSGEVLLARSLLGATEDDLAPLLREVAEALPVPIAGVLSDGQAAIRKAVASALPGVPHQRCQFRYLREAAKPIFAADRHAKVQLKKAVRGVRPLERALEGRDDAAAMAARGYCLAVRSALTDDGRPPLGAAGLRLHERLTAIHASLGRVAGKGGLPKELARLQRLLARGLAATAAHWPALRTAYGWIHRAAHLLANHEARPGDAIRADYRALLATMTAQRDALGALAPAVDQFLKVTASYWPGLFHCYEVPDVPRTNNDLEQYFGAARDHERRASGHKGASPALVVRGAVRVVAALATRRQPFAGADLRPTDLARWRALRRQLHTRQAARGAQRRFRHDPDAYLAALEEALCKAGLPA